MIRSLQARLWRILTAPFRLIAKPFVVIRDAIVQEPEESPVSDTVTRIIENPSILVEHIEALRRHLLRSLVALIVAVGVSTAFAGLVLDWLAESIGGIDALQAIEVT